MPTIHIPEFFRPTLERIVSMSEQEVEAVRNSLATLKPQVKPEVIVSEIEATEGGKVSDIADIAKVLSSLSIARLNADASLDDFVSNIARSVPARKDKQFDRAAFEARMKSLLSVEPLILSARAFNVQHEYEHVFRAARIITDIRPIFDHSGVQAQGLMIIHNLKISYIHNGEARDILFALDDADIIELKKILERAEIKSSTLEKLIDKTGVPFFESKQH